MAPSGLPEIFWTHSLYDLRTMVDLKIQEEMVRSLDQKTNLQYVIGDALSAIFGSKEEPEGKPPESVDALAAFISSVGGQVG